MRLPKRRTLLRVALAGLAVFLVLQVLPVGADRSNPPVTQDAPWPDETSRQLARDACYDCHSNESEWPFYSYVAPMSWLVTQDVADGREELNFSEWDQDDNEADDAAESVLAGDMPPGRYTPLHPDARLSDEEKEQLVAALEAMDEGSDGDNSGPGNAEDREDRDDEERDENEDRSGSNSGPG